MPRTRRYIRAGRPYELDIRVKTGLPFACLELIKLILNSALARAQRDNKVKICHHHWQGNHLHMLLIPYDAEQCVHFYQELQKKITEYMKRLLGVPRLNLWEGDPILAEILDVDKVISRITYYYANPSEANLVDSIDQYPGLSSWNDFLNADTTVNATVVHRIPWLRLPSIDKLTTLTLSVSQDKVLCDKLVSSNGDIHKLIIYPHAWLGCFNINSEQEVSMIKMQIIERLRGLEAAARIKRIMEGKKVFGVAALLRQPIMAEHTPPPRERRVYVLATEFLSRIQYIEDMKEYCFQCSECYKAEREGREHWPWPPGAIRPALRPVANAIADIGSTMVIYA